jgi:hypothetical protein
MAESMGFNSSRRGYEVRVPAEVVYNHSHNSNATHAWVHGEIVVEYVDPNNRVNTLVVDLGGGVTTFQIQRNIAECRLRVGPYHKWG